MIIIEDCKDFICIGKLEKEEGGFSFIRKDTIIDIIFSSSQSIIDSSKAIDTLEINTNESKTYQFGLKDRAEVFRCKTIVSEILLEKELGDE